MRRIDKIAEQLGYIFNITGKTIIELDFNDSDTYVYRLTFPMHLCGARLVIKVELDSLDVDFDKTFNRLLRDAVNQVLSQITFFLI